MWFKAGRDSFIPGGDVVGFFRPETLVGPAPADTRPKSVVLLKGRPALYSTLGLGVLVRRYIEGRL